MRKRWVVLLAISAFVTGAGVARPSLALSCIPLADVVAKMDVIVRGKMIAIPAEGTVELAVSKYYKGGSGPPRLQGQVFGLGRGQRMDWNDVPAVGDELVIGFVKQGNTLENGPCNLFVQVKPGQQAPDSVQSLLGPGQAPQGAVVPQGSLALSWPLLVSLAIVVIAATLVWRHRTSKSS